MVTISLTLFQWLRILHIMWFMLSLSDLENFTALPRIYVLYFVLVPIFWGGGYNGKWWTMIWQCRYDLSYLACLKMQFFLSVNPKTIHGNEHGERRGPTNHSQYVSLSSVQGLLRFHTLGGKRPWNETTSVDKTLTVRASGVIVLCQTCFPYTISTSWFVNAIKSI